MKNKLIFVAIALSIGSILIDAVPILEYIYGNKGPFLPLMWLYKIGFLKWGWILTFAFSVLAIFFVLCCRDKNKLVKGTVIFLALMALILALPWFWLMCVFELPT